MLVIAASTDSGERHPHRRHRGGRFAARRRRQRRQRRQRRDPITGAGTNGTFSGNEGNDTLRVLPGSDHGLIDGGPATTGWRVERVRIFSRAPRATTFLIGAAGNDHLACDTLGLSQGAADIGNGGAGTGTQLGCETQIDIP